MLEKTKYVNDGLHQQHVYLDLSGNTCIISSILTILLYENVQVKPAHKAIS